MKRITLIGLSWLAGGLTLLQAASDVQKWGTKFNSIEKNLEFKIPNETFEKILKHLGIYEIGDTPFTTSAADWVIDKSTDDPAEKLALKRKISNNPDILIKGKTVLKNGDRSQIRIDPSTGSFHFSLTPAEASKLGAIKTNTASYVEFSEFNKDLQGLLSAFGWSDSEIAKKPNGDYDITVSDTQRYPNHQKDPVLYARSIQYSRQSGGFVITSGLFDFKIQLVRFANGKWKQISVNWPKLTNVGTLRNYRSNSELKAAIEAGKALWDYNNDISTAEVVGLAINDLRMVYCSSQDGKSYPVMCLDCEANTSRGRLYTVLFLPLSDPVLVPERK
jgi:hypothetical protein